MQNVNVLQLQGTGDDEYAWENAGVFVDYDEAVKKLAEINGEYDKDVDEALFRLGDTARIEVHELIDSNWGY
tara:strand:+ start:620 stop:835 length:216 start_codon:yes stop_codon:yes gene_type:complete